MRMLLAFKDPQKFFKNYKVSLNVQLFATDHELLATLKLQVSRFVIHLETARLYMCP